MSALEFQPWPKIARLNREILITEKIDGTNAAIVILPLGGTPSAEGAALTIDNIRAADGKVDLFQTDLDNATSVVGDYVVFAQSRTRFVTPGADNFGFAAWVRANAETLVADLGPGTHFGEWWGSGIQRTYGLMGGDKRFSLFNVDRWLPGSYYETLVPAFTTPNLYVVPALARVSFGGDGVDNAVRDLREEGSIAAPGFDRPEGVVVWHYAARQSFKVLLEGDDRAKGAAA